MLINEASKIAKLTKKAIEYYTSENKEVLEQYLAYKKSEEYKNSATYKFETILKEFNETSGYYDVFIPAMKKLSASYSEYCNQMEIANEKLVSQYPEVLKLNNIEVK